MPRTDVDTRSAGDDDHRYPFDQTEEASFVPSARPPTEPGSRWESPGALLMNPLALGSTNYFSDTSGRPIYLGTSSNWSFGRRVLAMTHERIMKAPLPPENLHFEGKVYDLGWDGKRYISPDTESVKPALPSPDFAIYLINAFKFHCGQLFHLFEEENFMQQFSRFHEKSTEAPSLASLWYVHYLLILAFGKAFTVQTSKGRKPPGADLFIEAMKSLPDFTFFSADPIDLIQVLCCAALYLQCLDFRAAAYRMIGQALRLALENGMHTDMHSQNVDDILVQRCRKVWWTVYILDRHMSSLMGVPMGVAEESISAALPTFSDHAERSMALDIQIKLSRVLDQIHSTVYGAEGRLDKRFLIITKAALKSIANMTDQLNSSFAILESGSLTGISRLSAHLHLLRHQCIVLTTRPLLYSFLETKIGQSDASLTSLFQSGSVRTLLQMCMDSAQQILTILSALQEQGLLESFLPFDLDATFTSAIAILMAAAIDSSLIKDHSPWTQRAYNILDEMIARGNMVAALINSELQQLQNILSRLPFNDQTLKATRSSNKHRAFAQEDRRSGDVGLLPPPRPPPAYVASAQPLGSDLSTEDFNWQDGFTTEQMMNIADSIDLSSLAWLSASFMNSPE